MTADQLRAMADRLSSKWFRWKDNPTDELKAADYLRACADAMEAGPVAWGLKMPAGDIRLLHMNLPASINAQNRWPDAYNEATHIPLYPVAMPAPAIPQGWRLVPVEPTENMMAWLDVLKAGKNPSLCYRAMLASAPTPPVAALRLPEPMTDDEVFETMAWHEVDGYDIVRWVEAETLRRVKEANNG